MKDFFLQSETIWFLIGLVLILLELVVPGLVLFFFGIGAWVTAIACWVFDIGLNAQLFTFLITSIVSLVILRRYLKQRYMDRMSPPDGLLEDEYIGQTAEALIDFDSSVIGKVSFKGSTWEATTSRAIKAGQRLRIVGYKSIRLEVEPLL